LDKDALANRNRQLANAFHQIPMRHKLRRYMIDGVSRFPFAPLATKAQRVLFVRPDHIGDVLLSTPAIRALKEARPYAEIHVLCGVWAAPILANVPEIDRVLTIRFPGFDREQEKTSPLAPYQQLVKVSRQLRQIEYSSAVIMRSDHWWGAMMAHVAGIKERIGYDLPEVMPFLTRSLSHKHEHSVRQSMRLVSHWTGNIADDAVPYRLEVPESAQDEVNKWLKEREIAPQKPIICIHMGAGTWVKQWDGAKWASVANTLIEQMDATIIFTGTRTERQAIQYVQSQIKTRTFNTAGEFSLDQLTALYQRANVVVGVDSGPLHIASAVQTPTVTLFGPADPIEFAPWGDRQRHIVLTSSIACRPCRVLDWGNDDPSNHPCVRDIYVGDVLEATRRLLNT